MKGKAPIWISYLVAFIFVIGAIGNFLWSLRQRERLGFEAARFEITQLREKQREYIALQERQSDEDKRRSSVVTYFNQWTERRKDYDTREKVTNLIDAISADQKLTLPEDPESNRVYELASGGYRIEWKVVGKAPQGLKWVGAIEERIDFARVTELTWEIRDDNFLNIALSAELKFPNER